MGRRIGMTLGMERWSEVRLFEEYHSWGQMRDFEDALVVMLKFHPICPGLQRSPQ